MTGRPQRAGRSVSADTVQVWLIGTDQPPSVRAELESLLDSEERRRAGAVRGDLARSRFVVAHGAVRLIVGDRLGQPAERVRWRRGVHGKPELAGPGPGLQVSLSHSGELALVAVTGRRPVGVDIQELAGHLDPVRLATRYFSDVEARFVARADRPARRVGRMVRLWVRKEACVKAVGARLLHGLPVPVAGAGGGGLVHDPTGRLPGRFRVRDLAVPRGFRAAVALAGAGPFRVTRHRWIPSRLA